MRMNELELGILPTAPPGGRIPADCYAQDGAELIHRLSVGELTIEATRPADGCEEDAKSAWWRSYLRGVEPTPLASSGARLRMADLFCGPGGLANGVRHLCAEVGVDLVSEFVADQDEEATVVHAANHASRRRSSASITQLVDYSIRYGRDGASYVYPPELVDSELANALRGVDLVLAGPPCQGHSNLNNQTRRADPRNELYLTVPAFALAVGAPMCIIENVPAVLNDSRRVVETAQQLFQSEGYSVTTAVLSASDMGWPQARKRHFLVARRDRDPVDLRVVSALLGDEPRSVWWAIADLEDATGGGLMQQVTTLSDQNRARIDWLFDNDQHELDLAERPESHRGGTTYTAVYGRLRKDQPAPTITTGFMSPGRGRFTHPTRRRVLTPREAARLQGFPDTYRFVTDPGRPPARSQLAKWIGDAVPMPLGYAAALAALGSGLPDRNRE